MTDARLTAGSARRRVAGIVRKEFIHIFRDWRTLLIVLLYPVLMIVLFGYAITLDMRHIRFVVIDDARTPESRSLLRAFDENGFFERVGGFARRADVEHIFRRSEAALAIVVPEDFSRDLGRRAPATVQFLIDASDPNVGTFIGNYAAQVVALENARRANAAPVLFTLEPRVLYNPDLRSTNFFVPGLVALILLLISALLTSIAITREKETGTMEQILVSPIHPFEVVAGKVLPYVTIGIANGTFVLLFAALFFGVPVRGSLVTIGVLSLLYITVALSFGLMISTVARTQQVAMLMTLMATIMPTIMLSGFIFPVASMPAVLRDVARIIPAYHYLIVIRGLMLKGVGVAELAPHVGALCLIGALMIAAAVRRFKTTLE